MITGFVRNSLIQVRASGQETIRHVNQVWRLRSEAPPQGEARADDAALLFDPFPRLPEAAAGLGERSEVASGEPARPPEDEDKLRGEMLGVALSSHSFRFLGQ